MIHRSLALAFLAACPAAAQSPAPRPMTFLDMQQTRQLGNPTPSPDRSRLAYTLSTPDWKDAKRQTDLYMVSMREGVPSTRQMTFTRDKNETQPAWTPDGQALVFASNREAPASAATQNQLYLLRLDGGEARRLTDAKDGVGDAAFTPDGSRLIFAAGKPDERQLFSMSVTGLDSAKAAPLFTHPTAIRWWRTSPDSRTVWYLAADTLLSDDKKRREKQFTVTVRNQPEPAIHLWSFDIATKQTKRLTRDSTYVVQDVVLSPDGNWVAFRGVANDRYARSTLEGPMMGELYLLEVATGSIERLTKNTEIAESRASFSPDGGTIAFSASNDFTYFHDSRVFVRAVAARGQPFRELGDARDGDATVGVWSPDGKTIWFTDGVAATEQAFTLDVASGQVKQVTTVRGAVSLVSDERTGAVLVSYADPTMPTTWFAVASLADVADRARWVRLTDANPQIRGFALGQAEEITWRSTDGRMVGGVLVKPVGYAPGTRVPLIVAIHGGPAAADVLSFNGGYGSQVYAGAGYAVLMPNYRGSTNYGEKHRMEIAGDYFTKGYQDIMTGVDHLIAQGIVDGNQLGVLGWSAGGHWSNWILTHTDRFKAVSTGAGTMNWISMYAQSDVQRNRQFYMGGKLPYDDHEGYWRQSPLKYIRNAKTPTMIHVVDGDPRVPRPQSEELHMALRRLGVPTEFFVYPGSTHGIPDPRNQLVKSMAEFQWMEKWVRGKNVSFAWGDVLKTLDDAPAAGR